MHLFSLFLISGLVQIVVALKKETYSKPSYLSNLKDAIMPNVLRKYTGLLELQNNVVLDNAGKLLIEAKDGARIHFERFLNRQYATADIIGAGNVNICMNTSFSNSAGSNFRVRSSKHLKFNVRDSGLNYLNAGVLELKSANTIAFQSFRDIVNQGIIKMEATERSKYEFNQIMNFGTILLQSTSSSDCLSLTSLFNDGMMTIKFDSGDNEAVRASGTIKNSGLIRISGSRGYAKFSHGGFIQNDGTISLEHSYLAQAGRINGKGCLNLGKSASIELHELYTISKFQSIFLSDPSAVLILPKISNNIYLDDVYGVSKGSKIVQSRVNITAVTYDEKVGKLQIHQDTNKFISLFIGFGYKRNMFISSLSEVSYAGPTPTQRHVPSVCQIRVDFNIF